MKRQENLQKIRKTVRKSGKTAGKLKKIQENPRKSKKNQNTFYPSLPLQLLTNQISQKRGCNFLNNVFFIAKHLKVKSKEKRKKKTHQSIISPSNHCHYPETMFADASSAKRNPSMFYPSNSQHS